MKSQATRFIVAAVIGAFALAAVVIPAVARPTSAYAAQITDRVVSATAPSQGTDPAKKPHSPTGKRPNHGRFHGFFHGANFDRFLSSETRLLDKDNKPVTIKAVAGVITVVTGTTSLTIAPNGGGDAQTFTVNDKTRYFPPSQGDAKGLAALKVGDKVAVRTNNGSVTIVAKHMDPQPRPAPEKKTRPAPTKEQLQKMHDRLQKQLDEVNKKLAEQSK